MMLSPESLFGGVLCHVVDDGMEALAVQWHGFMVGECKEPTVASTGYIVEVLAVQWRGLQRHHLITDHVGFLPKTTFP